jgi:nicotinamide-nucleotide amidase
MAASTSTDTFLLVERLATQLQQRQWMLTTAESCTGGLIAGACTDLSGSSNWFERGFVSYSNTAKNELLGVDMALIKQHGAVSEEVARAMAVGALARSRAQVAVAVTGVAGPTGGTPDKPVGLVWFGFALPERVLTEKMNLPGDRAAVRAATVLHALRRLVELTP